MIHEGKLLFFFQPASFLIRNREHMPFINWQPLLLCVIIPYSPY